MPVYTGTITVNKLPAHLASSQDHQIFLEGTEQAKENVATSVHNPTPTSSPPKAGTTIKGLVF